jgi:hypothetical protein
MRGGTYQKTYVFSTVYQPRRFDTNITPRQICVSIVNTTTMATFRRENTGYIYLYQWLTPTTPLKVSTRVKIDEKEWNKKKSQPKDIEATYLGKPIVNELKRYEYALNKALSKSNTEKGVSPFVVMKVTDHKALASFERYVRCRELQAMIELKSLSFFQ